MRDGAEGYVTNALGRVRPGAVGFVWGDGGTRRGSGSSGRGGGRDVPGQIPEMCRQAVGPSAGTEGGLVTVS